MSMRRIFWEVTRWARAMRFWLLLALAFAAWAGFGGAEARADDTACLDPTVPGIDGNACSSRPMALVAIIGVRDMHLNGAACASPPGNIQIVHTANVGQGGNYGRYTISHDGTGSSVCRIGLSNARRFYHMDQECPSGGMWNPDTQQCTTTCANRPPLVDRATRGAIVFCHDGCSYSTAGATDAFGFSFGDYSAGEEWHATGAQCSGPDQSEPWSSDVSQETCRTIDGSGFNECVRSDGTHCVTGAKGSRMCWMPGESGERMPISGEEGANRGPQGTDPPAPKGMEDPVKITQWETTICNGPCETNTTNVFNGSGSGGGQSNVGSGGNDPGTGDGEGDGDGPGGVGAGVGDLYEGDGDTVGSVFSAFVGRIEGAPIMGSMSGFISVTVGGGCPAFTVPGTYFWEPMSIEHHCSGPLASALSMGGALLLAIAAFAAWRIAFH